MGYNNFVYKKEADRVERCEVADGIHKVAIIEAGHDVSRSTQKDMVVIKMKVADSNGCPYTYRIVDGPTFDIRMSAFLDCFGIPSTFYDDYDKWTAKAGYAEFVHEDDSKYGRQINAKRLLMPSDPAIAEVAGGKPQQQTPQAGAVADKQENIMSPEFMEDIPF